MTNVPPQKKSSASHEKRNAELKVTFINYDFIFCNHKFCFGNFQQKKSGRLPSGLYAILKFASLTQKARSTRNIQTRRPE